MGGSGFDASSGGLVALSAGMAAVGSGAGFRMVVIEGAPNGAAKPASPAAVWPKTAPDNNKAAAATARKVFVPRG